MILTVTLNPSVDRSYRVDNFRIGQIHRADDENSVAGGKGINVTKVIKSLNGEVIATGFLGGKSGEFIHEQLFNLGVECRFIKIHGETRTCIAILDPCANSQTEILEKGPTVTEEDINNLLDNFDLLTRECNIVVGSGSAPAGVPSSIYYELIKIANKNNAKFILDSSGDYLREGIMARPFMIKPNKEEIEKLINTKLHDIEDIKKAALDLHEFGIEIVSVSLGDEGSIIICNDGVFRCFPPAIKVASPVGSGDAYVGGMAVGIDRGLGIFDSAVIATACGTANAMYYQTGYVTLNDVEYLRKNVKVTKLYEGENKSVTGL